MPITLEDVKKLAHKMTRLLKPGPSLASLLPDNAADCYMMMHSVRTNPNYSPEQKEWAQQLLEARAQLLEARTMMEENGRRQAQYDKELLAYRIMRDGYYPPAPDAFLGGGLL